MAGDRITEKWEYKTDIITSYDGHEQRIKTRQYPRHYVSYDYPAMNCFEAQWLRGLGRLRQSDTYYIPMWHNVTRLAEDFPGMGKSLYINKEHMYSFDDVEWIEIFVKDDPNQFGVNMVLRVENYFDQIIGLKKVLTKPLYKENTWIYPLKRCSIQPMNGFQYIYSNGASVTHSFEDLLRKPVNLKIPDKWVTDFENYSLRNKWNLPEHYDNREVFVASPQWLDDDSLSLSVDKAVTKMDNETGQFLYDLKNEKSYDVHTMELILMCKEAINNMQRFFKRVSGMYKSFYAPTWANDIELLQDIEAQNNYIYTKWSNISDFYISNKRNKKLVIFTKDKHSYILDILTYGYEMIDGVKVGKIMFTNPLGMNIPKSNVLMCSYFNLVRFDSDELQLNYESDIVANVSLVFREVDE